MFSRSEERKEDKHVTFVKEDVIRFTQKLRQQNGANIWLVGGAALLDEFFKANVVVEFIITIAPIILGNGIPLFQRGNPEIKLLLKEKKRIGQFVQLHYEAR